ncbi:hypothetical protein CK219_27260 [Mesorhizobium sp. WSM4313]|nr:hypothetical protein CK219_27260 [Mesorhizobium sp. WSM4313]
MRSGSLKIHHQLTCKFTVRNHDAKVQTTASRPFDFQSYGVNPGNKVFVNEEKLVAKKIGRFG